MRSISRRYLTSSNLATVDSLGKRAATASAAACAHSAPATHRSLSISTLHKNSKLQIPRPSTCRVANMSRMPATGGHSEACCNIPPVNDGEYTPKGSYETFDGKKTYVTGPDDATKGIVTIYDVFGFINQTLQGQDLLSQGSEKRKVFMADFLGGDYASPGWFPPDTPEKQQKLGEYFGRHGPAGVAEVIPAFVKTLQAANPNITSWAVLGYCWGGKVIEIVTSGTSNPFSVAAVAHPAMVDPSSASKITVPYAMLASQDEPEKDVKEFEKGLKVPNHVEIYADQVHGWMAARADLKNARVKDEYTRGYNTVDEFFSKHQ